MLFFGCMLVAIPDLQSCHSNGDRERCASIEPNSNCYANSHLSSYLLTSSDCYIELYAAAGQFANEWPNGHSHWGWDMPVA